MLTKAVRGYVLAGGRSSRMGVDKAELRLGGMTLLERAVAAMRVVCEDVVIVGERSGIPAGTRGIADRVAGCGPMGGVVASLADCEGLASGSGGGWAVFLPVDMPLVPGELLRELVERWTGDAAARVCFAVTDGQAQPLVSAVHTAALAGLAAALEHGELKLRPLLEQVGAELTSGRGEALRRSELTVSDAGVEIDGERVRWMPPAAVWARRTQWFANVNTPGEMEVTKELFASAAG